MPVALTVLLVLLLAASQALGQPQDECIAAHEAGQRLRNEGKLREARTQLEACTNPSCPTPVQEDCTRWRDDIGAALPTVVASLREGDSVIRDAKLSVDGEVVQEALDGRAIEVDPGNRLFRFELPDGRVVEKRVMILEGVKNRVVEAGLPVRGNKQPPAEPSNGVPTVFWVTGAIGVAGLAAFAILGGIGVSKETGLRDECAGSCPQEDVDAVWDLYIAADVVGGVGVAALIVATVIGIVDLVDDDEVSLHPNGVQVRF